MPKFDPDQLDHLLADINGQNESPEASVHLNATSQHYHQLTSELHDVEPMAPSHALRNRLMASITQNAPFAAFSDRLSEFFRLNLDTINQHIAELETVTSPFWDPSNLDGIWLKHLDGGQGLEATDCGFVHMLPGTRAPLHRHQGNEWMYVIQGEALTDSGQTLLPGDLLLSPPNSCHDFTSVGNQPLVFAVIVFTGIDWLAEKLVDL